MEKRAAGSVRARHVFMLRHAASGHNLRFTFAIQQKTEHQQIAVRTDNSGQRAADARVESVNRDATGLE